MIGEKKYRKVDINKFKKEMKIRINDIPAYDDIVNMFEKNI